MSDHRPLKDAAPEPPPRSGRRHPVLGRVAFYGFVLVAVVPATFCHLLTSPPGGDSVAPAGFEELALSADGLEHRAFLDPGDPDLSGFVLVHGLGDSPAGMLPFAHRFRALGHSVLLPELRGHGASDAATTLGGSERAEVGAALDALAARQPGVPLVLMGFSMGSVAALGAAAGRDDLAAVIVEAPYDSYRETVAHHARLLYGLPRWVPLIPLSIALAERWAGFDADEIDAVAWTRALRAPLFVIGDGGDARMPPEVVRRVFEAHPGPRELWIAPGVGHLGAISHPEYWSRVMRFLSRHGALGVPPEA